MCSRYLTLGFSTKANIIKVSLAYVIKILDDSRWTFGTQTCELYTMLFRQTLIVFYLDMFSISHIRIFD